MAVKKKSVPLNRTPVPFNDVEELPKHLAVLAYGRSGTGKTTFASTFPGPILLMDIREKGWDSVSNVKDLQIAKINEWDEVEQVYWYLQKGQHKFKTVVIDQIGSMQDIAIEKAMRDAGKDPTDDVKRPDFGRASGMMKTWLVNYRDLMDEGMHVVFLAHDRVSKEDDGSGEDQIDPTVGARVMPSVASALNGAVKIIGNTFIRETYTIQNKRKVRNVEYSMRIGPHSFYTTKTRSPVGIAAPDVIVDPSYDKLLAVLTGTYSEGRAIKKVR
jgi:phage nucleotide-binding protein